MTLYWYIGRMIVERQRDEAWGRSVVERLGKDLQAEFPPPCPSPSATRPDWR